jgi:endoglucanase
VAIWWLQRVWRMCLRSDGAMNKTVLLTFFLAATLAGSATLGCSESAPSPDRNGDGDGADASHGSVRDGQAAEPDAGEGSDEQDASTPTPNHDAGPPDAGGAADASARDAATNPGDLTAQRAADEMGQGVNLGQMFENTQHPRTLAAAQAKIDAYHAKGFRNVRIPVTWTDAVDNSTLVFDPTVGEVDRNHPRLAVIAQVVDYALQKPGMYVVLNAHHERALKTSSRGAVLERLWQDIADIFRERDHRLLFEILNEPHREDAAKSPMPAADLRSMTGKAYRKIRAVDAQRIVIIGGNQWFGFAEMAQVWTNLDEVGSGNDPYVMATFHHYNPWSFCGDHQGDYADSWTASDIENPMDVMKAWATTVGKGMPVYIGEWGVGWGSRFAEQDCNNVRLWYQMFHHDIATPKGMPTSVWDDGGWFKIFDHASDSFANNLVDCINGSCDWTTGERINSACL